MSTLLTDALRLFTDSHCELVYLDEGMFPDPIVPARHAELFETLHALYCADTGTDPIYYSVRRILNWLNTAQKLDSGETPKAMAAHA